jgi:hypothetical protein
MIAVTPWAASVAKIKFFDSILQIMPVGMSDSHGSIDELAPIR